MKARTGDRQKRGKGARKEVFWDESRRDVGEVIVCAHRRLLPYRSSITEFVFNKKNSTCNSTLYYLWNNFILSVAVFSISTLNVMDKMNNLGVQNQNRTRLFFHLSTFLHVFPSSHLSCFKTCDKNLLRYICCMFRPQHDQEPWFLVHQHPPW